MATWLRFNDKFRAAASPALQSVTSPLPQGYSFALEERVVAQARHEVAGGRILVEVRVVFEGASKSIKLPRSVSGAALLGRVCGLWGLSQADSDVQVEVDGTLLSDLGRKVELREESVVQVAAAARREEAGEDRIPCDRCGMDIAFSQYLLHEQKCKQ